MIQNREKGNLIYVQGSFDLFHFGHLNLLKKCKKLAGHNGKVIAALHSDEV